MLRTCKVQDPVPHNVRGRLDVLDHHPPSPGGARLDLGPVRQASPKDLERVRSEPNSRIARNERRDLSAVRVPFCSVRAREEQSDRNARPCGEVMGRVMQRRSHGASMVNV
jgi:hypothetical protein